MISKGGQLLKAHFTDVRKNKIYDAKTANDMLLETRVEKEKDTILETISE